MDKVKVVVGLGSCGIAAGAGKVYQRLLEINEAEGGLFELGKTSCIGMCYKEPLVEVTDGTGTYLYGEINDKRAEEIIEKHVKNNQVVTELVEYSDKIGGKEQDFVDNQVKIVLRNCGKMDPESIDEYEKRDGYKSNKKDT